jgi:drug/metabolite transporter (DMT)-like permease
MSVLSLKHFTDLFSSIKKLQSAFICSMAVVTVPILDYMFGKRLLKRQVLGAVLATIGVWALEMGGEQGASLSSGDLISLVQPVMFGLGFWRMEAAMEKYPTEAGRLAAAQLLMVFLVSLSYLICRAPMADACEAIPTVSELMVWLRDPYVLGMLLWTGIVTTAFTIWMETLALKTLSAAETTLIFSTEPLFGAAFSAIVANECFGNEAAIGAAFIIGGCLVSGLDLSKKIKGLSLLKWNMKKIGFQ